MKRTLLLLAAFATAAISGSAFAQSSEAGSDEPIVFSYHKGPSPDGVFYAGGTNPGDKINLVCKLHDEDIKTLAGSKITGMVLWSPVSFDDETKNTMNEMEICIFEEMENNSKAVYTQTVNGVPGTALTAYTVTLDTPYTIEEGKLIYFGYSVIEPEAPHSYVIADGEPADMYNLRMRVENSSNSSWMPCGDMFGSLCVTLLLDNSSVAGNKVDFTSTKYPEYVKPGENGSYTVELRNEGSEDINNVEITTTVGDETPVVRTYTFDAPLTPYASKTVEVENIPFNNQGFRTVKTEITKINDSAPAKEAVTYGHVAVMDSGFDRHIVMEEGTGTWCGWCVSGIVMLDYINQKYPDTFFPIAVHSGDQMVCGDYTEFCDTHFSNGLPNSWINREFQHAPGTTEGPGVNEKAVDDFVAHYTSYPAYCQVTGNCNFDEKTNSVTINATTEFALDCDVQHSLNFVLVENNVGPYRQSNYYAGGEHGPMGGWEDKSDNEPTRYNDVARAYASYGGVENSIPATVSAGTKYDFSQTLDMADCSSTDMNDYAIICFITNNDTKLIVNACKMKVEATGVETINAEEGTEEYFNLQGMRVDPANCASGIYIVRKGGKATKTVITRR